jgi:hypothetical protein
MQLREQGSDADLESFPRDSRLRFGFSQLSRQRVLGLALVAALLCWLEDRAAPCPV